MEIIIQEALEILEPLAEKSVKDERDHHYYIFCDDQFDDLLLQILESVDGDCYENPYDLCESCAEKIENALCAIATPSIYSPLPGCWSWRDRFISQRISSIGYSRDSYSVGAANCNWCGKGLVYYIDSGVLNQELSHFLDECPDWDLEPYEAYGIAQILEYETTDHNPRVLELAKRVIKKHDKSKK